MSLKNIIVQLYFFTSYLLGFGQEIPYKKVAALPTDLKECSGLVALAPNALLMINDGGNKPEIFVTDTLGNLLLQREIPDLKNVDWEAVTFANGILFIGDFGNNKNKRKNLKIYRVDVSKLLSNGFLKVLPSINFSYANQKEFPPQDANLNFDMEAMVAKGDSLFLFSKNRTYPFDGKTYGYTLPQNAGTFRLQPSCFFTTGQGAMPSYWITDAAYHPQKNQLALLGSDKLWLLSQSDPECMLIGETEVFYFNHFSQKEAICWAGNKLFWADERNGDNSGFLYTAVPNWQAQIGDSPYIKLQEKTILNDSVNFTIYSPNNSNLKYEVFNTRGKRSPVGKMPLVAGENKLTISLITVPIGSYVINLIIDGKPHAYFIKKRLDQAP
jgi:hypothetical protein